MLFLSSLPVPAGRRSNNGGRGKQLCRVILDLLPQLELA